MGKHRPEYTPHVDTGEMVIVTNATKVGLTGRKAEQRLKMRYSKYPGGLKAETYGQVRGRRTPSFWLRTPSGACSPRTASPA